MPQPDTLAVVDFAEDSPFRRSRRDFLTGADGRRSIGEDYWIRVHQRAMACRFEVTLPSHPPPRAVNSGALWRDVSPKPRRGEGGPHAAHTNRLRKSSIAANHDATCVPAARAALNELDRVGVPLPCGPDKAFDVARGCIRANEAIKQKARLTI